MFRNRLANVYVLLCKYTRSHGLVGALVEMFDRAAWINDLVRGDTL